MKDSLIGSSAFADMFAHIQIGGEVLAMIETKNTYPQAQKIRNAI